MTLKSKISLLVSLTSVSIVSIGFSSWSITVETNAEAIGNIEVDNVIQSDKFIKLDDKQGDIIDTENLIYSGIDSLDYNENGYVNELGINGSKGSMEVFYVIDVKESKNFFIDCDSLKIILTLRYANQSNSLDMFANNAYQSINYTLSNNMPEGNDVTPDGAIQLSIEVCLANLLTEYNPETDEQYLKFSIKYEFFAAISGGYYNDVIYPFLIDNDFSLIAHVEGY